jgi:hypothetical protein
MALVPLGKIAVVAAGTPKQIVSVTTNANGIFIQALSTNAGKIYIGTSALVKATFVGVLRVLEIPGATPAALDSWNPQSGVSVAPIDLSTIFLDADVSGEGVLVSYLVV